MGDVRVAAKDCKEVFLVEGFKGGLMLGFNDVEGLAS